VRLILDGMVVRVRLAPKASAAHRRGRARRWPEGVARDQEPGRSERRSPGLLRSGTWGHNKPQSGPQQLMNSDFTYHLPGSLAQAVQAVEDFIPE
jgi:hypothetical protein